MIFIFTAIIITLSFVHIDQFDFQRWEVWVWFLLYIILPINAGYHLWLYRNWPPADATPLAGSSRTLLFAQAILLGLYGLTLILIPSIAKMIWSWEIDNFHAQLYSVTFITPALGAYILTKGASKLEWQTLGFAQISLGLLPVIGVLIVDASTKRVAWSTAGTWTWLTIFTAMLIVGIWMMNESRKK